MFRRWLQRPQSNAVAQPQAAKRCPRGGSTSSAGSPYQSARTRKGRTELGYDSLDGGRVHTLRGYTFEGTNPPYHPGLRRFRYSHLQFYVYLLCRRRDISGVRVKRRCESHRLVIKMWRLVWGHDVGGMESMWKDTVSNLCTESDGGCWFWPPNSPARAGICEAFVSFGYAQSVGSLFLYGPHHNQSERK